MASLSETTDNGHPERKKSSQHGQKFNPNPKFYGTAKAYFVCHIGAFFQISLIYAFIGCPQSVSKTTDFLIKSCGELFDISATGNLNAPIPRLTLILVLGKNVKQISRQWDCTNVSTSAEFPGDKVYIKQGPVILVRSARISSKENNF